MFEVLPYDAHCEDFEVDTNLTFLNGYVQQALANGMQPYLPPEERIKEDDTQLNGAVKTNYGCVHLSFWGSKNVRCAFPQWGSAKISIFLSFLAVIFEGTFLEQVKNRPFTYREQ